MHDALVGMHVTCLMAKKAVRELGIVIRQVPDAKVPRVALVEKPKARNGFFKNGSTKSYDASPQCLS